MINIDKAFAKTLQDCGIKAVLVSEKSGVGPDTISSFINGKTQIKTKTLERLLEALPMNARDYFFNLLRPPTRDIKNYLDGASQEEKAEVLRLVAASLEKSNSSNSARIDLTPTKEVVSV